MTKPATATQAMIRRAIQAVRDAGLPVAAVEITATGRIIVRTIGAESAASGNEWDDAAA